MKHIRKIALVFLAIVAFAATGADLLAPYDYSKQFRDHAGEPPSSMFPLGTDDLGRDRLSRLMHATRVSIMLAPMTAFVATVIGAGLGLAAGWRGGWLDTCISLVTDLFLSLPWLFLLLTLRALLPLDASAPATLAATAILLAGVGWGPGTRLIRAAAFNMRASPWIIHARASGCGTFHLLWVHVLPNLTPAVIAQFWVLVPAFLITEANLGLLGLGVSEPLPSLGNMMAELRDYARIPEEPWLLAPALLLVLLVSSLHLAISGVDTCE